ncbi:hypothetical protein A6R68_01073 [Neotoma lepida]|uniref:Uncharacterized protein n=1 Tax=Neotoma lepida TaxID=56216 RepID=A0A1A6GW46_NEOLE|nr:hypothetical protein A6R68_01073 [Neotoma lepida]
MKIQFIGRKVKLGYHKNALSRPEPPPPFIPSDGPGFRSETHTERMDPEAAQLEKQHVHDVYESTAPYFSDLQSKAWPRVRQFLQDQKPGSLVADIGITSLLCQKNHKSLSYIIFLQNKEELEQ